MKNLVEKYFNGETTLQEEAELRRYFNSTEIDEELRPYQALFRHFNLEREQELGPGFDSKLLAKLDTGAKVIHLQNRRHVWLRIAAAGAVLAVVFFLLQKPVSPQPSQAINWEKYEIKDEQAAYEETVKALKLLSSKLNKGSEKATRKVGKVEKIGKYFN